MTERISAERGATVTIRGGYLRAQVTGDVEGVRLSAVGPSGADVVDSRESDRAVVVLPTSGHVSFVIAPGAGGEFAAGTRVGLVLESVSGPQNAEADPAALDIARLDVGAFRSFELAECLSAEASWRVGIGVPAPTLFQFASPTQVRARLDERETDWVVPGRYIVRTARGGTDAPVSARPWALVVDSSASFSQSFGIECITEVTRVVAGIMAEDSGVGPEWLGTSGLTHPVRVSGDDPLAVASGFDQQRPASWCLVAPCAQAAVAAGARDIVVISDMVPADLPHTMTQVPREEVAVNLVLLQRGPGGSDQATPDSREFRAARVEVVDERPTTAWDWAQVCALISDGGRR